MPNSMIVWKMHITWVTRLAIRLSLCVATGTSAQVVNIDNNTMTPTFGAGHSYIQDLSETVNPANGSVSVRIAFPMPKGRGLSIPFSLNYDSTAIVEPMRLPYDSSQNSGEIPDMSWAYNSPVGIQSSAGWSYGIPSISMVGYSVPCSTTNSNPVQGTDSYVFYDSSGSQHPLYVDSVAGSCGQQSFPVHPQGGDGHVWAEVGQPQGTSIVPSVSVFDGDGTQYQFQERQADEWVGVGSSLTYDNYSYIPTFIEDRNGNEITSTSINGTNYQYLDTLGRTAFTIPHSAASSTSSTIEVGGMSYTVAWGTASASYSVNPQQDFTGTSPSNYAPLGSFQSFLINCGDVPNISLAKLVTVSSITIPDGGQYKFFYNGWGLLTEIDYPTGAWAKYTWKLSDQASDTLYIDGVSNLTGATHGGGTPQQKWTYFINACVFRYQSPVLATRSIGFSGSTTPTQTQAFTYATQWSSTGSLWTSKTTTVVTKDIVRNLEFTTVYAYTPRNVYTTSVPPPAQFQPAPTNVRYGLGAPGQIPMEQSIQYFDWENNTAPVRTENQSWDQYANLLNSQVILNSAVASQINYSYLNPGNIFVPSEVDEYDFGQNLPTRRTVTTYQDFTGTPGILADRPCKTVVYGSSGNPLSESDFYYDGSASLCASVGAAVAPGPVSALPAGTHDETAFGPGATVPRGNVTKSIRSSINGVPSIDTYSFDETGQLLTHMAPCGNPSCPDINNSQSPTTYTYTGSSFTDGSAGGNTNAYVSSITEPSTNGVSHITQYGYRLADGQVSYIIDENQQRTDYQYQDPLARLTDVFGPPNDNGQRPHTQRTYTDGTSPSWTNVDPIGTVHTVSLDGRGNAIRDVLSTDPAGADITDTEYDGMGRVFMLSNPYRSQSEQSYGVTTFTYDALGRKIKELNPDNVNSKSWSYSGNSVVYTDENKNQWVRKSDAFGHLIQVIEPGSMLTTYQYDALGNLSCADQWGTNPSGAACASSRPRRFTYDGLSQLITASNPESGTTTYSYDANGNLQTKTDARGVTTRYTYDALNRVLSKIYSNDAGSTPLSCYQYDSSNVKNGSGRLSSSWTESASASATCSSSSSFLTMRSILSYDSMGRVTQEKQYTLAAQASGRPYAPIYTYDLAGNLTYSTSGVGPAETSTPLAFTYMLDGAGRVQKVTSNWTNGGIYPTTLFSVSATSSSSCSGFSTTGGYSAFGGLLTGTLGNGISINRMYDNRLRIACEMDLGGVGTNATSGSVTVTVSGSERTQ